MKLKMLAVASLLVASSIASAQSVTVGYALKDLDNNAGQTHLTSLAIKNNILTNVAGDIGISADQNDKTNAIVNRYELGLTYSQKLTEGVTGDFRVANGWKAKSGVDTSSYYVLEPSVTARIANTPMSVKVGYRWRNAWSDNAADTSETTRLAVSYDVTKKDKVTLGLDRLRGDGANTQTTLQYTRAF
jgi:hypothetical protein